MSQNIPDLSGIHVPFITPFENDQLSEGKLRETLQWLRQFDLRGFVALGSTGEAILLSPRERTAVLKISREMIPPDRLLIAGTMFESEKAHREFIRECADLGVDAMLVLPPCYYRGQMRPEILLDFYSRLADDSPLPLIIYHFPAVTGISMSAGLIARIAAHPKVIGIKDSSANISLQQELIGIHPPGFAVLTGSANTLAPSGIAGAAGGIVAFANLAPEICLNIWQCVQRGNLAEAREKQLKIVRLTPF